MTRGNKVFHGVLSNVCVSHQIHRNGAVFHTAEEFVKLGDVFGPKTVKGLNDPSLVCMRHGLETASASGSQPHKIRAPITFHRQALHQAFADQLIGDASDVATQAPDETRELAREVVHDICAACGPATVYIPKDDYFGLTDRDLKIFSEYKGYNVHSLAKTYGVSPTRIRQIHAKVLASERAKRQTQLPGL